MGRKEYEEAAQILTEAHDKMFSVEEGSPESLPQLLTALVGLGRTQDIEAIQSDLNAAARQRYLPRVFFACLHGALGEVELALKEMESAWEEHDTRVPWYMDTIQALIYPEGDPSPRFLDLRAKFEAMDG